MAKNNKSRKGNFESFQTAGNSNFIAMHYDLIDSKAFKKLSAYDERLYRYMRRKYKITTEHKIITKTNKNDISVTDEEIRKNKLMSPTTFWNSIDHLIEFGFIKIVRSGYEIRECNIYAFNDMWQRYGTKDFEIKDEWRRPTKRINYK